MNIRIATLTLLLALLLPTGAMAYNVTWDNYDSIAGVEVLFGGGNAQVKNVDGYKSLGVSGGVGGEISIGQSITMNFSSSQFIDSLSFVALFADGNYNDVGDEIAQVTGYSGGQSWTYTLTAGINAAVWTGLGQASPLEFNAGLQGNGGVWDIVNPFGDAAIDSLVFTALDNGIAANLGGTNSDFGIGAVTTSPTPIPAAVWIFGSGLLGLIGIRRTRK